MGTKTVFISYRRDAAGKSFARSLERELTHRGYDVFLDVDSLDAGRWADQILTQVPLRSHFLLLLTPDALDRCADEADWVRREYETAAQHARNIVPVREESVDLVKLRETCPECMKSLFDLQIATVQHGAFERDIQALVERYIPPHKAPKPAGPACAEIAITRLRHSAERLCGRDEELQRLDAAWADPKTRIVTLVAWGGVGKTSLVSSWASRLAQRDYNGARYFDWSFYSQGTREQTATSSDSFIAAALEFFGDTGLAKSAASPWDKGARLAQLVAERRTLLVLDGLEPLQYPPGPLAGEVKDPALAALLRGLAQKNPGLCLVTTRERVADLASFRDTTAPEWELKHLSVPAGVELLKTLGVHGRTDEFERLVTDVKGHALTLNLLGRFLARAHQGDIRRRDQVKFEKADAKIQGGHAFKAVSAYEHWLTEGGDDGARQLALLRLLGLFDRPADAGCLAALRREPAIPALTEALVGLGEDDWNLTLSSLADCGLVSSFSPPGGGEGPAAIDAHPLIREYFAKQLRAQHPDAWRAAHRRLYEHLTASVEERLDTLEQLQPLYQAVAHGCQAGMLQEAFDKVFYARIQRAQEFYSSRKLGAFGAELGAVSWFFEQPWSRISPALTEAWYPWLLNEAAFCLRALGRLNEALEPTRAGLEMLVKKEDWKNAAISASNLSELELTLGEVAGAVVDAEQSVTHADRSGDAFHRMGKRTTLANALHQLGRRAEAEKLFREAEAMQTERQPGNPLLYSLQGFGYCDLLLAASEHGAWQRGAGFQPAGDSLEDAAATLLQRCHDVTQRAAQALPIAERNNWLLDIALDHLTLGRAALYASILDSTAIDNRPSAIENLQSAVDGLRRAGGQEFIVRGLLTRGWLRFLEGNADGARADLDEAWEIAERGPMPLFLADIHLHRARLFHAVTPYPWESARADLAAVRRLIKRCGYGRRKEELADAEEAAKHW